MKPLLRVLSGENVWPPPVWLMRQAGRYLPEYRDASRGRGDFLTRCTTPELAAAITLQPVHRYGMDAAILFSDILLLPWALGQDVRFVEGEGPVMTPLRDRAALEQLDPAAGPGRWAPVADTVRRVAAALPGGCTLIGFAGSPFTVACYMVEGGGSRDFAETRRLAYAEPALFRDLLRTLCHATVEYLGAQVEAGAEALMLFDSWAGILPAAEFRRHVTGPTVEIVDALNRRHPGIPVIGFPRLATPPLLAEYVERTGVDAVGLDTAADAASVAADLDDIVAIQGNLDPVALLAGGEPMRGQARAIRDALRGRAHIFNLGHGILPQTPPEHVAELLAAVRDAE